MAECTLAIEAVHNLGFIHRCAIIALTLYSTLIGIACVRTETSSRIIY
jgi:hypothetical protein